MSFHFQYSLDDSYIAMYIMQYIASQMMSCDLLDCTQSGSYLLILRTNTNTFPSAVQAANIVEAKWDQAMSHTPLFKSYMNMGSSEGEKTHQFLYTIASIYYPNILTRIYTLYVHHYLIKLPIYMYIYTYIHMYIRT